MDTSTIISIGGVCSALGSIWTVYKILKGQLSGLIDDKLAIEKTASQTADRELKATMNNLQATMDRMINSQVALEDELRKIPDGIYSMVQKHETKIPDLDNRISRLEK